jgi:vancomycin resistance protein YoaR
VPVVSDLSLSWRRPSTWALLLAVVAAVLVVLVFGAWAARAGEALPGTEVENVDVGGLGPSDLRARVDALVEERQGASITVTAEGETFTFTPGADGFGVDVDATVARAMDAGRDGVVRQFLTHLTATFGGSRQIDLVAQPGDEVVAAFVDRVAAEVDQEPFPGDVSADHTTLQVSTVDPQDGRQIDQEAAIANLTAQIGRPDPTPVTFSSTVVPAKTTADDVAEAAAQAERILTDSIVLTTRDVSVEFTPADLATLLVTRSAGDDLVLSAEPDQVVEFMTDYIEDVEVDPVDATFEVLDGLRSFDEQGNATFTQSPADLQVVPSSDGARFDVDLTVRQFEQMFADGRHTGTLELRVEPPSLTTQEAQGLGVDNLIGTFTTYHACCANRVINIQRMADLVRGTVLRPGEEFSINDHVGQRTRENGFVADGAIFQGEIRPEVGGGVSQFATTMYNASFFSGIEIMQHRAHSLYISRYPLGREATLNFPHIDLRIRNTTDAGLFIHTSYTPTSITVSLFGDNDGRRVQAVMGEPYNFRDYPTRTRQDPGMAQGQQRVTQSGTRGYNVKVLRIIEHGDREITEEIYTTYQPRPQIVLVGTGQPAPPPPPPSEPAQDPSPPATQEPTPTPNPSE